MSWWFQVKPFWFGSFVIATLVVVILFLHFFSLLKSVVLKLYVNLCKWNWALHIYISNIRVLWLFSAWSVKGEKFSQIISCSEQSLFLLFFKSMMRISGCDTNFWNCLPGEECPVYFFFFPLFLVREIKVFILLSKLSFWTRISFSFFFFFYISLPPRQGEHLHSRPCS